MKFETLVKLANKAGSSAATLAEKMSDEALAGAADLISTTLKGHGIGQGERLCLYAECKAFRAEIARRAHIAAGL